MTTSAPTTGPPPATTTTPLTVPVSAAASTDTESSATTPMVRPIAKNLVILFPSRELPLVGSDVSRRLSQFIGVGHDVRHVVPHVDIQWSGARQVEVERDRRIHDCPLSELVRIGHQMRRIAGAQDAARSGRNGTGENPSMTGRVATVERRV